MFSKMGDKKFVALDWDAHRLRVVHAAIKRGAVRILHLLSADIPPDVNIADPAAMGAVIRQVLSQQNIRTNRAVVSVPRDQALLTSLKLPLATPEEMPAVVEFQITKELPFPIAQAVVDYATGDGKEGDVVDVMVGTVRRDVVHYFEQTLGAAGLEGERLGLRPDACMVSLEAAYGHVGDERLVFIDVGPTLTEIDVVHHGAVVFSRAASVTLTHSTAAGESKSSAESEGDDQGSAIIQFPQAVATDTDRSGSTDQLVRSLLMEVARSIEAYRGGDPSMRFDRIVVGGSVGLESALAARLGDRFGTPAELYNPAGALGWPSEQGQQAQGFAAPLGLVTGAASDARLEYDFLHPKRAVSRQQQRLRKAPYAAIAALLFIGAGVTFYVMHIAPQEKRLADLKKKTRETKKETEDLEEFQEKTLAYVNEFEDGQIIWLDELDRIVSMLPSNKEMVLTRIDMNQKGAKLTLPLECNSESQISQLVEKLNSFRLQGSEEPYYEARQGPTTRQAGQYKVRGRVDVTLARKQG